MGPRRATGCFVFHGATVRAGARLKYWSWASNRLRDVWVDPQGFRDVFETKVTGVFLVARAVVPRMLAAGSGRIVNISMSGSTMTRRGFVPYGPSGAAVEAMSRIMAAELDGTGVTVNLLLPGGATATGMVPDDAPDEFKDRLLEPSVMGAPIVWLASSLAAGVHDQRIIASEFDEWLTRWQSPGHLQPGHD